MTYHVLHDIDDKLIKMKLFIQFFNFYIKLKDRMIENLSLQADEKRSNLGETVY